MEKESTSQTHRQYLGVLQTHGHSLDEESLQTPMTQTEAIINSQPLTVHTINDGQSPKSISPNDIFTVKTKVVMPPPGFSRNLICFVEVGGGESNILVTRFGVGGERDLSKRYSNIRSGPRCQETSALVTLHCRKLI